MIQRMQSNCEIFQYLC